MKPLAHLKHHIASCPKSGLLRSKAIDNDEEQYWEASAVQMYNMLGQIVSLEQSHDVLKASFKWRHNRIGNRCPCSEIPTVRTRTTLASKPQLSINLWLSSNL